MEEKDFIKDLFQEKLSGLETPVRPELWSAVSTSIGASTVSTGLSLITKLIIGTSLTAAVSVGIWVAVSDSKNDSTPEKKPSKIESKKHIENISESEPKFSNDQINNPEVDKFILIQPVPETTLENEKTELNLNSNNSISEFKGQISDEKVDLQSVIEQKTDAKTDAKVEKTTSKQNLDSKQAPIESEVKINLPNVFTPNGDGSNDYLSIPELSVNDFSLVILDESGKTVYTSIDIDFRWDGRLPSGEIAPAGNYVYFITAKDAQGKSVTKYSQLNIRY